jgi:hypothetical protein
VVSYDFQISHNSGRIVNDNFYATWTLWLSNGRFLPDLSPVMQAKKDKTYDFFLGPSFSPSFDRFLSASRSGFLRLQIEATFTL